VKLLNRSAPDSRASGRGYSAHHRDLPRCNWRVDGGGDWRPYALSWIPVTTQRRSAPRRLRNWSTWSRCTRG